MRALLVAEDAALAGLIDRLVRLSHEERAAKLEWCSGNTIPRLEHVRWEKLKSVKELQALVAARPSSGRSRQSPFSAARGHDKVTQRLRLTLVHAKQQKIEAVVFGLDTDNNGSPREQLEAACGFVPSHPVALLAAPRPEAEAWYLLGLQGRLQTHEAAHHSALCRELKFDPCEAPHQLSSTSSQSPRDAKRALRHILDGSNASSSVGAEEVAGLLDRCFHSPACVERHAERGGACGLNAFVGEVRTRLWR